MLSGSSVVICNHPFQDRHQSLIKEDGKHTDMKQLRGEGEDPKLVRLAHPLLPPPPLHAVRATLLRLWGMWATDEEKKEGKQASQTDVIHTPPTDKLMWGFSSVPSEIPAMAPVHREKDGSSTLMAAFHL